MHGLVGDSEGPGVIQAADLQGVSGFKLKASEEICVELKFIPNAFPTFRRTQNLPSL